MTKISYNSNNKNSVINSLNTCIDNLTSVNNILYNTYAPTGFYYKNTFYNMKNDLVKLKSSLSEYKSDFNKYAGEIDKDELELSSRLNKIEEITINNFEM